MTEQQAAEMLTLMQRAQDDRQRLIDQIAAMNDGLAKFADQVSRIEALLDEIAGQGGTVGTIAPPTPGGG